MQFAQRMFGLAYRGSVLLYAGTSQTAKDLDDWSASGALARQFAAASRMAEDVGGMDKWPHTQVVLFPPGLPMAPETPGELPVSRIRALAKNLRRNNFP